MTGVLRKVFGTMTTVMLVLVIIVGILLVGVRVIGLRPYAVLSGSMEPIYHVGSLIYVKKVDPLTLKEEDPVTYRAESGKIVTHKIIEVVYDQNDPNVRYFRTQGEANNIPDGGARRMEDIIGKPVFTIPYMGYFAYFVQNPPGTYFAIAFCLVLIIVMILPELWSDGKEKEAEDDTQDK